MTRAELSNNELILVDTVLAKCALLEASIGIDSNNFEREEVRLQKEKEYQKIKVISEDFYKQITERK